MTRATRETTRSPMGRSVDALAGCVVSLAAWLRSVPRAGAPIPPGAPARPPFNEKHPRGMGRRVRDNKTLEVSSCFTRYC